MATSRATFGSILSAVGTAANAVSTLSTVADNAFSMAVNFTDRALQDQQLRGKLEAVDLSDRLVTEFSQSKVIRDLEVLEFIGKSSNHTSLYESAQLLFSAALTSK